MLMWATLCLVVAGQATPVSPVPIEPPREFRAAWVATVANIDWPSKPGLSVAAQQAELRRIVDVAVKMRLNALIFQVRPHADAVYESRLEPWSWYLTGEQGRSPGYDPLQFLIDEAHKAGIEVHAWFNPYRSNHFSQKGPVAESHFSRRNPGMTYPYGNFEWMDPGLVRVQDHSAGVIFDVVERYDIDGVHIDDYFYPYPVRSGGQTVRFPDQATYDAYRRGGGTLSLSDWRRENVNRFVKRLYDGIKQRKRWVKFGISPFGIYRPGIPAGIQAGIDQYEDLAADARLWWREGWCDYYSPQLYWPIEQQPQSFPVLLNWWAGENVHRRHLWPGLYTSRLNPSDGNWRPDQIERQVSLIRRVPDAKGEVHFSMKAIVNDWNGIRGPMRERIYEAGAVVPASPWLDETVPAAPAVVAHGMKLTLNSADTDRRFFVIVRRESGRDILVAQTSKSEWTLSQPGRYWVAVRDRAGNLGPAVEVTVP